MNDGDPLDSASKVTKIVPNSKAHNGTKVDGCVLRPRKNEEYMSVNWLEYDGDKDLETCLTKIMNIYLLEKRMNVKDNNWLPVINVQKAIEIVRAELSKAMKVLYKPELQPAYSYNDPSHSGAYGYSGVDHEDALIGDLISEVVESLHKAKDYKNK